MKKIVSCLSVLIFLFGCVSSPYVSTVKTVYEAPSPPGLDRSENFYNSNYVKFENCAQNNDPSFYFFEIVILIQLSPYLNLDENMQDYLLEKEKEYKESYLPKFRNKLLFGFKDIGVTPNNVNLNLLTIEYLCSCREKIEREATCLKYFKELDNMHNSFWQPILNKVKSNCKEHENNLTLVATGKENVPFYNLYLNMENYAKTEFNKLKLLELFYNNYVELFNRYVKNLSEKDKEQLRNLFNKSNVTEQYKFLKTLNPELILNMHHIIRMYDYAKIMKQYYKLRKDKLYQLATWLNENKAKAEQSLKDQETIRAERAKALTSALLIGLAGGLAAYDSYLSSRPQTQNIWLYDNKGNYFWGTIK